MQKLWYPFNVAGLAEYKNSNLEKYLYLRHDFPALWMWISKVHRKSQIKGSLIVDTAWPNKLISCIFSDIQFVTNLT